MTPVKRSWKIWFLPFLISLGMALGSLIGMAFGSDAMVQEGSAGDVAGAAGALIMLICIVMGFIMSFLAIIPIKIFRLGTPDWFTLRLGLSILTGVIIGIFGTNTGTLTTMAAWIILVGIPVLLTWPCPRKRFEMEGE